MRNYNIWLSLFLLVAFGNAFAQPELEEHLQQQEQLKRIMLTKELDSGVYYMDLGKYADADAKFRHVLANIRGVPSNLAFYFGKNSYFLGQYKQSIDWLNKYIQLKGTNGQYSEDAVSWLRRAEAQLLLAQVKEREAEREDQVLSSDYDIDCGPTGKVICPVCRGDHVIIKRGAFNDQYQTCPYCNEHGILTCEEYNLLIKGELKPKF